MGLINVDRVEDAWRALDTAETLANSDQTHGAVLKAEDALEDLFKATDSVDEDMWFAEREKNVRDDILLLKEQVEPPEDETNQVIAECREIAREVATRVVTSISEEDNKYEPTIRLGDEKIES